MKEERSWRFTHAVSRLPGKSIANGLRAGGGADPDPAAFLAEHQAYTKALQETGANITVLDALEEAYPMLRGTIRDHVTHKRRPFVRFFACQEDLSHEAPDTLLPDAVARGREPYLIVGAIAGG